MLFDLRGRGRRRTVQVIYLTLAILLGGGLVLFGIGGDVQGGLVDALTGNSGNDNSALEDEVERAEERVQANRQDAAAWAALAQARVNLAGVTEGYDESTQQYTGESRQVVAEAARAWDQHLKLAGDKPDAVVAASLSRVFVALDQPEKAVRTQEIVIDSLENPGYGDYNQLALYAWLAGQNRKGDLAAAKALEDAKEEGLPKEQIDQIKADNESIKTQIAQQQAQEATQGAGGAPQTPVQP